MRWNIRPRLLSTFPAGYGGSFFFVFFFKDADKIQHRHFVVSFYTVQFTQTDIITKTRLFKYTENFTPKNEKFQMKNSDILHISAQNIDCGYSLEPPQRGGSNEYSQSMF